MKVSASPGARGPGAKRKPKAPPSSAKPSRLRPWRVAVEELPREPCGIPPEGTTCPTMQAALRANDGDMHRSGINVALLLTQDRRGKGDIVPMIIYRRTPADTGVALNFCPWCGGQLLKGAVRWGADAKPKASAKKRVRR